MLGSGADVFWWLLDDDGEDEVELVPMETTNLPWALALTVGLGSRPRPPINAPVELRSSALDRAADLVAEGNRDGALATVSADVDMSRDHAAAVTELLERRHISWRASSVWTAMDGREQTRTVTVVDGGTAGLWFSWSPAQETTEPAEDPPVTLTPTTAKETWSRLVDLFPAFPEPFQEITEGDTPRG